WQYGQFRPGALVAGLLWLPWGFCSPLFWGFLDYYSGLGVAFLGLTHLVRLRGLGRGAGWQWGLQGAFVTLRFRWHPAARAVYGVLGGALLLTDAWAAWRRWGQLGRAMQSVRPWLLAVLPSLLLCLYYLVSHRGEGPATTFVWGSLSRKLLRPLAVFRG